MSEVFAAPEKSTFERLLGALGKLNGVTLNHIARKTGLETGVNQSEILKGEKEYTPRDFLTDVTDKTGIDLEFGSPDKKMFMDKALNFATEVALGTVTDPLTFVSGGAKLASKVIGQELGVGVKAADKIRKALSGGVIGATMGDTVSGAVIGAGIGSGVGAFGGDVIRGVGKQIVKKVGDPLVDIIERGLNPEVFKGSDMQYSEAFTTARKAQSQLGDVARQVREIDKELLDYVKANPETKLRMESVMDKSFPNLVKYRNKIESQFMFEKAGGKKLLIDDAQKKFIDENAIAMLQHHSGGKNIGRKSIILNAGKKFIHMVDDGSGALKQYKVGDKITDVISKTELKEASRFKSIDDLNGYVANRIATTTKDGNKIFDLSTEEANQLTRASNTYIGAVVQDKLAQIGDPKLIKGVNLFVDRNRKVIDFYNKKSKEIFGDSAVAIEPIDFHIQEIKPFKKGVPNYDDMVSGFVRRTSDGPIQTGGLKLEERIGVQQERFYRNFMGERERKAEALINAVAFNKPSNKNLENIKNFTKGYDNFTQFLKQQHLTMSHTWVATNFVDNLTKAYMSGGLGNLWETAKLQSKVAMRGSDKLVQDLMLLTDPNQLKSGIKFNTSIADIAKKHGAISENIFSDSFRSGTMSKEMLIAKVGNEEAARIIGEASKITEAGKLYDQYAGFLKETVGRTGSNIEAAARLTTFKYHVDDILNSQEAMDALGLKLTKKQVQDAYRLGYSKASDALPQLNKVYDEAARITNEVFFDYGNVSAFEEKIVKRIFPYWTFFSKNFPQWVDMASSETSRLAGLAKTYRSLGRKPTDRERIGMPDYMLESAPRMDSNGRAITVPNMSLRDAMSFAKGDPSALEKIHPLLKVAYQLTTSTNEFGQELLPSNTRQKQVRVFGAGEKFAPFTSAVYRDKRNGNKLYTDSDLFQVVKTVQQNLAPVPIVDTIARALNRRQEGDPRSDILSGLTPVKINSIDQMEAARTKYFRENNKLREDQYKRDIERTKELSD